MFKLSAKIFVRIVKTAFNTTGGKISGRQRLFVRKLFFCRFVFGIGDWNSEFLAQNPGRLPNRVSKNTSKKNVFIDKKARKTLENKRNFSGFSAIIFVGIVEFAFLKVQESNCRYYFLQSLFFLMLPCLERKFFPPLMISFSSLFQKPVLRGRGHFEMKRFFGTFFVFFFKNFGYLWRNFLSMSKNPSRWSSLQSKCPEEHSPEKCFWKTSSQEAVGPKNSNYWPKVSWGLS